MPSCVLKVGFCAGAVLTSLAVLVPVSSVRADGPPIRIMPLGDSMTHGNSGLASYRYPLFFGLQASGLNIDFVGSMNTTSGQSPDPVLYPNYLTTFDRDHEGHTGVRADEFPTYYAGSIATQAPDIALIHLGTNDLLQNTSSPSNNFAPALNGLSGTIDALRAGNPTIRIALAQIIPFSSQGYPTAVNVPALNAGIAALAASKNTAQSPILLVNQSKNFDPMAHTFDRIHANKYGENLMAARWNAAIHKLLNPSATVPSPEPRVANSGFEDGTVADGVFSSIPANRGWSYFRGSHTDVGVFNPAAAAYPGAGGNGTPQGGEGGQAGFLYVGNSATESEAPTFSQPTGAILNSNMQYTLTVAVGNPLLTNPDNTTWGGYALELLAGDTVIASEIDNLVPSPGTFTDVSISVLANSISPTLLGEDLTIRLRQTSLVGRSETDFDNVRFTAVLIPEPATGALVLLSAAMASTWRGKRGSRTC